MLPYVLPITLGLLTAAAVVVVLIEVVPKVLEDFEREKEKLRREREARQRVAIPMRAVSEDSRGAATGVSAQGEAGYAVRRRRSRIAGFEDNEHLAPSRRRQISDEHHILGSASDFEDNGAGKDDVDGAPTPMAGSTRGLTPVPTGTTTTASTGGTIPLFSPASLSVDSDAQQSPFLDPLDSTQTHPSVSRDASRSPTLVPSSSSENSPYVASTSAFSSPSLPFSSPTSGVDPFADFTAVSKPLDDAEQPKTGELLFELGSNDGEEGWYRSPTLKSDAGGSGSEDGWTKLSDEGTNTDDEWAEVDAVQKKSTPGVGLGFVGQGRA